MEITEVRVRLVNDKNERLKAFCCMTIDGEFVVRDIKVIDGAKGLFVAMPSRKITDHCPRCGGKNALKASYCNECGAPLRGGKFEQPAASGDKLHADVAHPINSECRARIQEAILEAYQAEATASREPGYEPRRDASDDYEYAAADKEEPEEAEAAGENPAEEGDSAEQERPGRQAADDFSEGIF